MTILNILFTVLLVLALGSLIFLGYKRPYLVRTVNFVITRMSLGACILFYAAPFILLEYLVPTLRSTELSTKLSEHSSSILTLVSMLHILCWLAIIFAYRGIFELLAQRPPAQPQRSIPHKATREPAEA